MAKPKAKKMGSFLKRTLAAVVMLPVVIGALWEGYPYIDALVLVVGAVLSWEWGNMVKNRTPSVYTTAYIFSMAVSLLIYDSVVIWAVILLTSLFVWLKASKETHRRLLTLGVPYISIGVGSLMWIYHDVFMAYPYSFYMTLWFCLMVWSMDIGAYIVGSNLKGPKLAPKISPNKTWSGLIGGIVFAVAVSVLYFHAIYYFADINIVNLDANTQTLFGVLGGAIAAVSQIGDLIESAIKRRLGVKDSSNLIPGHGGVFDRIDGLIFAAPIVYWLFAYGLSYL